MRRGDVDDTAPAAFTHQRKRGGGGVKGRAEVDGDDRVPLLGGKLLDRRDVLNAGIVDEDIADPGLFDQRAAFVGLGHVRLDIARLRAGLLGDAGGQRVILFRIGKGIQHHVHARAREFLRDAEADTRIRSRNDGGLAFDTHARSPNGYCLCSIYAASAKRTGVRRSRPGEGIKKTPAQGRGIVIEAGFIQARNLIEQCPCYKQSCAAIQAKSLKT